MTPISTVTIYVALHPWCRDEARDADVRAAEDGRNGPLPTLDECIAMIPKIVSASSTVEHENKGNHINTNHDAPPGARVSDRQCAGRADTGATKGDGMRTERITLEVTHDLDARLSDWIVEVIDESLGLMESVRVVKEAQRVISGTFGAKASDSGQGSHIEAAREVPDVVRSMHDLVSADDEDERHAALATLVEAVCPGYVLAPAASGAGLTPHAWVVVHNLRDAACALRASTAHVQQGWLDKAIASAERLLADPLPAFSASG